MATAGYFHDFTPAEHKETTVTGSICGAFLLVSLARKTNCYFGPICCYFIWLHLTGKSIRTHFISEKKLLLLGINNTRRLTSRWPEAKNIVGNRSIQAFFFLSSYSSSSHLEKPKCLIHSLFQFPLCLPSSSFFYLCVCYLYQSICIESGFTPTLKSVRPRPTPAPS